MSMRARERESEREREEAYEVAVSEVIKDVVIAVKRRIIRAHS